MITRDKTYLWLTGLIVFSVIVLSAGQNFWKTNTGAEANAVDKRIKIVWCTINRAEQRKCENFAWANERDRIHVGYDYFRVECKQAFNKDECMNLLDEEKVTLTSLDAGEVFIGGRYHSLVPIAQEVSDYGQQYYSVAVVKKGSLQNVNNLRDLRGKKACFAGVGTMAGWIVPIYTLLKQGGLEIIDCNNHVKSATHFFGPSCAVNALSDKYNPIGDNSDKLCYLCIGKIPGGRCTDSDPYAGYEGAFRCLLESGEVAFLKHSTVLELTSGEEFAGITKANFELLCKDGSRRPVDDFRSCNWGTVPSDAIVTSSASTFEDRQKFQKFLEKASQLYAKGSNYTSDRDANRQSEYDQFGNRVNDRQNEYGRQNEFDQYGNRVGSRFKRQNFGSGSGQFDRDDPNRRNEQFDPNRRDEQYDPNRRNEQYDPNRKNEQYDPNRKNEYDPQGQNYDPNRQNVYNNNPTSQYDPYRPRDGQTYGQNPQQEVPIKRYNSSEYDLNHNPYENDPFRRDPYNVNREQYGVNIDPYGSVDNYNRNTKFGNTLNDSTYDTVGPNYDRNGTYYEVFNLFESSPRYGLHTNLLFQDSTRRFASLAENQQTFSGFLGSSLDTILGVRYCPVGSMTLCVTSEAENEKCVKMRTALKAQLLKPEMNCYKAHSQINCMQAIRAGQADVAVLDASDVYTAGLNFDLVPFISEVYNLGEPNYYVVAVAKEADNSTDLTYLRGKYTCHGGISTAAGWVYPLAFLISNGWIRPYGCNAIRAAAEYFTKSCIPGALSSEYNTGVPYDNMCDLCHGASFRYCRRDASEDYYGHTGALRCLVEGGGHVAFVKHTTVQENTGGLRKEWWARDALTDDFELLCPDGTRAKVSQYERCNLGKVRANAIVTRGGYGYNETQINAYINLFLYSQTFYGRRESDEFSFSMYYSKSPYADLIFQDATQQLKVIEPSKRYYSDYLGSDFMRARRIVDCHAGASARYASVVGLAVLGVVVFWV